MVDSNTTTQTHTIYVTSDAVMDGFLYGLRPPQSEGAILTLRAEERGRWLADRPAPPAYWASKYSTSERAQRAFKAVVGIIRDAERQGNIVWLTGDDYAAWDQLNAMLAGKGLPEIHPGKNGLKYHVRYGRFELLHAIKAQGLPYAVYSSFLGK